MQTHPFQYENIGSHQHGSTFIIFVLRREEGSFGVELTIEDAQRLLRDSPSALDRPSRPTSRASWRSLGRQTGALSGALQNRASIGRCATRGLRARPPPNQTPVRCHFNFAQPDDISTLRRHAFPARSTA
jgi:hypothetical protein